MIYFTLRGGLGNMLFQIASVTAIALSKDTQVSFNSLDDEYKTGPYEGQELDKIFL